MSAYRGLFWSGVFDTLLVIAVVLAIGFVARGALAP